MPASIARCACFATVSVVIVLLVSSVTVGASAATPHFSKDVLPIVRSHCAGCHGPDVQEAGIRLDNLSTDLIHDRAAAEHWHEVLNVLNAGEMPPAGEPQLSSAQRQTMVRWISAAIQNAVEAQRTTGGRVVQRRLNRVEYQNTMSDLLGLEMDYTRDLPPDPVSPDGFRNNGQSLQMSALQLEVYLETARRALDQVIVSGPAPPVYDHQFSESNVRGWLGGIERSNRLGRQQAFLATMVDDYPEQGAFLVRVTLTAELKPDAGFPLLELSVGYRPDTKVLFREVDVVEITSPGQQVLEFRGRVENHPLPVRGQGKYPGLVVRARNLYDDGSPRPKGEDDPKRGTNFPDEPHLPTITIKSVEFHGPVFDQWPPAMHRQILFESDLRETDEPAYVAEVLKRFMPRAYRRPVQPHEIAKVLGFFQSIRQEFPTFEGAIRETLAMVLIRPEFLYLLEPAGSEKRPINNWELASRLSYFLWSTMPDQRLSELAAAGKLRRPDVLAQQVDRMLSDARSSQFIEQFTGQWLQLDVVDRVAVSRAEYPAFDDRLKAEMRGETQQFFKELLDHDLSALNLLASDFTMLNEPLAKHYGVDGVYGQRFRRVSLEPRQHRGGLLGQASVLLSNSTGVDSHPVRRAVWIRDRLLHDAPAPPPPDVPSLDQADPEFLRLSVREQLEIHRGTEACAGCHRNIDPWGIALENFDAVGLWRNQIRRKVAEDVVEMLPADASDVLPDGYEIDGAGALREYLVTERKNEFARSTVARLLTFALGRRLELSDQETVANLTDQFAFNDYRLRGLIQDIAASVPFQTK